MSREVKQQDTSSGACVNRRDRYGLKSDNLPEYHIYEDGNLLAIVFSKDLAEKIRADEVSQAQRRLDALRTEAVPSDELKARITPEVLTDLLDEFICLAVAGQHLDFIKKHIFYGKPLTLPERDALLMKQEEIILDKAVQVPIIRLLHGIIGLGTEVGEIYEQVISYLTNLDAKLDTTNLVEELGDMDWYTQIVCSVLQRTLAEIQTINTNKLRKRYPDKFTSEKALNRDLESERAVLEGKDVSTESEQG